MHKQQMKNEKSFSKKIKLSIFVCRRKLGEDREKSEQVYTEFFWHDLYFWWFSNRDLN